mmetsp:Transcript_5498/g.6437  ORF Transcript_5498/g.6437 Transcript_5498/m.6437 type:complete len:84 (+) Transcript_5498:427-678(+)
MDTLMDLGCDMYVNAKVKNFDKIFVNIGLNCHVELTLNEAETAVERWMKHLNSRIYELASKRAVKKAQIKLISEKLQQLTGTQ